MSQELNKEIARRFRNIISTMTDFQYCSVLSSSNKTGPNVPKMITNNCIISRSTIYKYS